MIQLEEPAILKHPGDFPLLKQSTAALASRKGSAQLALAVYFGDPAPIYEKLQALPVDVLGLDFTYNPKLVDLIAARGSDKTLAVGLVDGRNTRQEDPNAVARELERLFRNLPSKRAILNPSCGLEYLPRDRARLKLKLLPAIKKVFLGGPR